MTLADDRWGGSGRRAGCSCRTLRSAALEGAVPTAGQGTTSFPLLVPRRVGLPPTSGQAGQGGLVRPKRATTTAPRAMDTFMVGAVQ